MGARIDGRGVVAGARDQLHDGADEFLLFPGSGGDACEHTSFEGCLPCGLFVRTSCGAAAWLRNGLGAVGEFADGLHPFHSSQQQTAAGIFLYLLQ